LSCKYGVKRKTGSGIAVPANIGGPTDKPGGRETSSSTVAPKNSAKPKPFIMTISEVIQDAEFSTSPPDPKSTEAAAIVLVADINKDVQALFEHLENLFDNPGSQEAKDTASLALRTLRHSQYI
jgi:hypothetical protein